LHGIGLLIRGEFRLRNVLSLLYKKAFFDKALFSHDLQNLKSNGVLINGQCMYEMQLISFLGNNLYAVVRGCLDTSRRH